MVKLKSAFYLNENVLEISKALLGKKLCTQFDEAYTSGIIIETEAYAGITDKASHAYGGRRTQRTQTMYMKGGVAYIYLCYGMHHLFNIVTNQKDIPNAVLIRALLPVDGITTMLKRRKKNKLDKTLSSGPGSLCQALGITVHSDGTRLDSDKIWIENTTIDLKDYKITSSPRIGIAYAKEHALLPWRFCLKNVN